LKPGASGSVRIIRRMTALRFQSVGSRRQGPLLPLGLTARRLPDKLN
jgi:hypothetical protein